MALAWGVARAYVHYDAAKLYDGLPVPTGALGEALLTVWVRWDAVHHLNLARLGYGSVPVGDTVFYPLYALLTRGAAFLLGGRYVLGGLVLSTVAAAWAFGLLYRLAAAQEGEDVGRWAVVALAVYPTAFFLVAPYTESLFLALTLGAFVAASEERWGWAGVWGFGASLARGPGMLTALALAVLAARQWWARRFSWRDRRLWLMGLGVVMPLLGGAGFLLWRAQAGFPSVAQVLKAQSGLVMTDPFTGLWAALQQWARVHDLQTTLDTFSALAFLGLTAGVLWVYGRARPEWAVYMLVNMALLLSKRSFVASSLQSFARYVLVLFPAFVLLGRSLARAKRRWRFVYLTLSSALLLLLSASYALWVFVG